MWDKGEIGFTDDYEIDKQEVEANILLIFEDAEDQHKNRHNTTKTTNSINTKLYSYRGGTIYLMIMKIC